MKSLTVLFSLLCLSVSLQAEELLSTVSLAEELLTVTAVPGKLRGTLSARYEQLELQRMQSMDI